MGLPIKSVGFMIALLIPVATIFYVDKGYKRSSPLVTSAVNGLVSAPSAVRSANPKRSSGEILSVEQPANVEPYYRVPLYSDIGGRVRFIEKDLGHAVKKNEIVAVIDPPRGSNIAPYNVSAPFDGVISARTVDPGDFVVNAGVVPGAASLLTVERNDIVTVTSSFPDFLLGQIDQNAEVELIFDDIPGKIKTKISRIAPSVTATDRTIKVEIDLYNRRRADFDNLIAQESKNAFREFKGREPPLFPHDFTGVTKANLTPGSYGRARLSVKPSQEWVWLPVNSVVRIGGVPYVYKIEDGVVHKKRVAIVYDDGKTVSAKYLAQQDGVEIMQPIGLEDELVVSNQSEILENERVDPVPSAW